jgi:hypothetical protein
MLIGEKERQIFGTWEHTNTHRVNERESVCEK